MSQLFAADGAGDRDVIAYPNGDAHVPAELIILNFPVDDMEAAVDACASAGSPSSTTPSSTSAASTAMAARLIAWSKDPAGNTLAVLQLG